MADAAAAHRVLQDAGAEVGELLRWEGAPPMSASSDPGGNRLSLVGPG